MRNGLRKRTARQVQSLWQCETLEERRLLALAGIGDNFDEPILFFDGIQTASYNAGTGDYALRATATSYFTAGPVEHHFAPYFALLEINLSIDNSGMIIGGSQTSEDIRLAVDLNSNGVIDGGDDILVTGTIEPDSFAFDHAANTEYIFGVTGGTWQSFFFVNKTVGVVLNLINAPNPFNFTQSFQFVTVKGVSGSLAAVTPEGAIDIEKYVKPVPQGPGGEGLTPGYWKQPHHFDDWFNYQPTDSYNTVFGVNDPDSPTLLGALKRGGGSYKALGRHAVAALLNASNPDIDYAFSVAQIIALVQQAYATNDFESIKNQFATENEKGAQLGDGPNVVTPPPGFGDDADDPTGPVVPAGSEVLFTFVVTNPGTVPLANVVVIDNNETPLNPLDDFMPTPVLFQNTTFNIGDDNMDGRLDPGELWLYTHVKVVTPGQHTNIACVTGTPVDAAGNSVGDDVTDCDPANWTTSPAVNAVDIEKFVKDGDASNIGGEGLTPGFWKQLHHFEYWTNYLPTDSFNAVFGVSNPDSPTLLGALRHGGGGAEALGRHAVAALLNASHPNVEYAYTVGQIIAFVQAAYANNSFEGIKNILAMENEKGADLTSGGGGGGGGFGDDADSMPGVNIPVGNQVTFTYIVTNPGQTQLANVVVVDDNETLDTIDDYFPAPLLAADNIHNIGDDDLDGWLDPGEVWLFQATKIVTAGQHTNVGSVTATPVDAGGNPIGAPVSDQDLGNWFGITARIGDYVWRDLNANGRMDAGEPGVQGVIVNLLNAAGGFVAGTVTDANGYYKFQNLPAGHYMVHFVKPSGFTFTTPKVGDDAGDSDADTLTGRTSVRVVEAGVDESSINAGLVSEFQTIVAAPSFWTTTNGQSLLKLLNVTSAPKAGTSTALGNWLASNFANIYNVKNTPNYFAGKNTTYVAARYVQMYNANPSSADVQVLSLLFSMYVTTTGLNSAAPGQNAALQRGFTLSTERAPENIRNKMWNVGDDGEIFATTVTTNSGGGGGKKGGGGGTTTTTYVSADNQDLTVWTMLQRTNQYASGGVLWAKQVVINGVIYAPSTLQAQARSLFSSINELGSILQ